MLLRGEPLIGSHILRGMYDFRHRRGAESGLALAATLAAWVTAISVARTSRRPTPLVVAPPPIMHNPTELPLDYHAANSPVIGSTRSLSVTRPSGRSVGDSATIANG